ncbi:hypothetical protein [uncultured Chryseobacterium sp.]|uniref:hypothetical protein n=1 Tax=uncultured Chryseobacterium sp. TaxID=259322 RepID=UPI0025FE767C|nr:hypothetical protein [uncultured Chryseobacterium sp.]
MEIRYKLFETRDKLRNFKLININACDDETFDLLDDYASKTINLLPTYNFSNLYYASKVRSDEKLLKEVSKHSELIKNSKFDELKKIDKEITRAAVKSLVVNSGGWIYIIVPIVVPVILLIFAIALITDSLSILKSKLVDGSYKMSYAGATDAYNSYEFQ